ncbi:hypothetical protein ABS71_06575 [bacterium SCN 62-11]|nr:MAG: hypothetical protein ABS71_06575 [bacterium SCN 62-11]
MQLVLLSWLLVVGSLLVLMLSRGSVGSLGWLQPMLDLSLALYSLGMLLQFTVPTRGPGKLPLVFHFLALYGNRFLWHYGERHLLFVSDVANQMPWLLVGSLILGTISFFSFFRHFNALAEHFERKPALADFNAAFLNALSASFVAVLGGAFVVLTFMVRVGAMLPVAICVFCATVYYLVRGMGRFCDGLQFLSEHLYRLEPVLLVSETTPAPVSLVTEQQVEKELSPLGKARRLLADRKLIEAETQARLVVASAKGTDLREATRVLASILREQERYEEAAALLQERVAPRPVLRSSLPKSDKYLQVVDLASGGQVGIWDESEDLSGRFWSENKWQSSGLLPAGVECSFHPKKMAIDWWEVYQALGADFPRPLARCVALGGLAGQAMRLECPIGKVGLAQVAARLPWARQLVEACRFDTSDGGEVSLEELRQRPMPVRALPLAQKQPGLLLSRREQVVLAGNFGVSFPPDPSLTYLYDWTTKVAKFVGEPPLWGFRKELKPTQILLELLLDPQCGAYQTLQSAGCDLKALMQACCERLERPGSPKPSTTEMRDLWALSMRIAGPDRQVASEHVLLSLLQTVGEPQEILRSQVAEASALRTGLAQCVESERLVDLDALQALCSRPGVLTLAWRSVCFLRRGEVERAWESWAGAEAYRAEDPANYLYTEAWLRDAMGDLGLARACLEESYELRAELVVGLDLVTLLRCGGQLEQAWTLLARLDESHPGRQPRKLVAQAFLEPERGVELCDEALRSPYCPLAAYEARALARLHRGESAEEDLRSFVELAPGYLDVRSADRQRAAAALLGG